MTSQIMAESLIFLMYVVQGLPFGMQTDICTLLLKKWGCGYQTLSLLNLSFWPWVLKPVIAPFVEHSAERGLSFSLWTLVALHCCVGVVMYTHTLRALVILLMLLNTCVSIYDISVDKLAILHRASNREASNTEFNDRKAYPDVTNALQVTGYKIGSFLSGSLVMCFCASTDMSPDVGFLLSPVLSAVITSYMAVTTPRGTILPRDTDRKAYQLPWRNLILDHFRSNMCLYVLIATYKLGETIGDKLLKLYLLEIGMDMSHLAVLSSWTDIIGILGSLSSLLIPYPKNDSNSLFIVLACNIIPQVLRFLVIIYPHFRSVSAVMVISTIEYFIGGAVTVALFNLMFSSVLRSIEGTHYSIYASLEVCGKLCAGSLALYLVPILGFEYLFFSAVVCSFVPLTLLYIHINREINLRHLVLKKAT